jgi:release factor glutamine methyltransferase
LAQTIKQALNSAVSLAPVSDNWRLDAELLLSHVLNVRREYLFTWPDEELSVAHTLCFSGLVERRKTGEPVAYLRGKQSFWSLELVVDSNVLIPRPETELLVETALALFANDNSAISIADLGTGSGAIAAALATEKPAWELWAVDKSKAALAVAEKNAELLGLNNVRFALTDWCSELPRNYFDGIIANPPYVEAGNSHLSEGSLPFEPQVALVAANKGMADIETIIDQSRHCLKPGGWLLLEHGFDQSAKVVAALNVAGFSEVSAEVDLAGIPRIAFAQWQGNNLR